MKNARVLFVACLMFTAPLASNVCNNCPDTISHTFMFTRPLTQHLGIEQSLWHNLMYKKKREKGAAFQVTAAYQKSLCLRENANYFLLPCQRELLVSGDANTSDARIRDVRAEWLGLPSDFRGRFTVDPKQRQMGLIFEAFQDLATFSGNSFFEGSWVTVEIPVVRVENNLAISQKDIVNPGTTGPRDIIEAFRQCDWLYAKMNGCCTKTGVPDIAIKLGKTYLDENDFLVAYYTKFILPTGNVQNPEFIFSPVVGNNNHFGYGGGVNFQLLLNRDTTPARMCMFINFESVFLARNTQKRTFDLMGKPFSRYMQFVDRRGTAGYTIPGVNVLTQEVKVHPYGIFDFSAGFRFKTHKSEWEFGYSIWAHVKEKIKLRCPFPNNRFGIAGNSNPSLIPDPTGIVVTASKSTIDTQADNDVDVLLCPVPCTEKLVFVPIRESDLDLDSAAAKSAFNHKVHVSVGVVYPGYKMDGFIGLGVFYDLPMKNSALNLFGGWAKVGAAF